MGCAGDRAIEVISNKMREFPPPQYNDINVDLKIQIQNYVKNIAQALYLIVVQVYMEQKKVKIYFIQHLKTK